jgi:thioredoxin-related protein
LKYRPQKRHVKSVISELSHPTEGVFPIPLALKPLQFVRSAQAVGLERPKTIQHEKFFMFLPRFRFWNSIDQDTATMRRVALATIASLAVTLFANSPAGAEIPWQKNLRAAHTKAEAEGKLMLLHFYSDNCVYCERLEAGAFQAPEVGQAISQNFVAVKVHANSAPELAKMFKVTKFPTDVVVTTEGKKIVHQVSPQDPNKYVAMLAGTLPKMPVKTEAIAATPPAPESIQAPVAATTSVATTPAATTPAVGMAMPESVAAKPASANPGLQPNSQLAGFRDFGGLELPDDASVPVTSSPAASSAVASSPAASSAATSSPTTSSPATPSSGEPELAMEGFCAVTVISEDKWVEGKPEHGVIHLGKLYLFQNEEAMSTFLADPVPFTPVLNEIDVVRFFEERTIVPGKREWGVKDPTFQRMFFFADEAAMNHFIEEHQRYTDAAMDVMQKAVKDANPDS